MLQDSSGRLLQSAASKALEAVEADIYDVLDSNAWELLQLDVHFKVPEGPVNGLSIQKIRKTFQEFVAEHVEPSGVMATHMSDTAANMFFVGQSLILMGDDASRQQAHDLTRVAVLLESSHQQLMHLNSLCSELTTENELLKKLPQEHVCYDDAMAAVGLG